MGKKSSKAQVEITWDEYEDPVTSKAYRIFQRMNLNYKKLDIRDSPYVFLYHVDWTEKETLLKFEKWFKRTSRPWYTKEGWKEGTPPQLPIYHRIYMRKVKDLGNHKLDKKLYDRKWYPWTYKDYMPTVVLQGWTRVDRAKTYYKLRFGKDALHHIRFIRGAKAKKRGFQIGVSLPFNGRWLHIVNKVPLAASRGDKELIASNMGKVTTRKAERDVNKRFKRYGYKRDYYDYDYRPTTKDEKLRLQKKQEAFERGKNLAFED